MAAELATEVLFNASSHAITANEIGQVIDVSRCDAVQIDIDVTVAGVSPTVTVERISPNGVAFNLITSAAIGVGKLSILIAPGAPAGVSPHQGVSELPGNGLRITVTSTSATFSLTVYGR